MSVQVTARPAAAGPAPRAAPDTLARWRANLGRGAWSTLHSAPYGVQDQAGARAYEQLAWSLVKLYPCCECREAALGNQEQWAKLDAVLDYIEETLRLDSLDGEKARTALRETQDMLALWARDFHAWVNARLNKDAEMDAARPDELRTRWDRPPRSDGAEGACLA